MRTVRKHFWFSVFNKFILMYVFLLFQYATKQENRQLATSTLHCTLVFTAPTCLVHGISRFHKITSFDCTSFSWKSRTILPAVKTMFLYMTRKREQASTVAVVIQSLWNQLGIRWLLGSQVMTRSKGWDLKRDMRHGQVLQLLATCMLSQKIIFIIIILLYLF